MDPLDQLVEGLSSLVGFLNDEDCADPEVFELLSELADVLKKPHLFPDELEQQILSIADPIDRFKAAAMALGVFKPEFLKKLAIDMRYSGYLNAQNQ